MTGTWRKLAVLWVFYFTQGLPYGFYSTALPAYLREAGLSLTGVGLASALSLPWMLKVFWAPAVDRYSSERWGRRRSWILPLQVALALSCIAAAWAQPSQGLTTLLTLVLLMNFCAATMDIAVDGLAVDLLEVDELGKGNIAQVVGFKIGILTGGGLLVWASDTIGWEGLFFSMGGLVLLSALVTLFYRERRAGRASPITPRAHLTFSKVFATLKRSLAVRGTGWLLLFIASYKLGENMADTMFKPFLIDSGYTPQQIGLWVGTWGLLFSIAGSIAGGLLASRISLLDALAITATLRLAPVAAEWWLSVAGATEARVIAVTCAENFFGGALTTAMFAFMMSRVDKRIGATHYTLLASVEVWGKVPAAWLSGVVADATSYPFLFGVATVLSALFLLLLVPLRRFRNPAKARTG